MHGPLDRSIFALCQMRSAPQARPASCLPRWQTPTTRRTMHTPDPRDLFGEIPVTVTECLIWVEAVAPRWAESSPQKLARYITEWNVPAKIQAAKAQGNFDQLDEEPTVSRYAEGRRSRAVMVSEALAALRAPAAAALRRVPALRFGSPSNSHASPKGSVMSAAWVGPSGFPALRSKRGDSANGSNHRRNSHA